MATLINKIKDYISFLVQSSLIKTISFPIPPYSLVKNQDSQNVRHCKIPRELPNQSLITAPAIMASASPRSRMVRSQAAVQASSEETA